MTNQELFNTMEEILRTKDTIFDKYEALSQIKEYKTTTFYKTTKKSIYDAFELYMQHDGKIINFINTMTDPVKIDTLLERIVEIFDVEKYMDQLSPENKELLGDMFKNLS